MLETIIHFRQEILTFLVAFIAIQFILILFLIAYALIIRGLDIIQLSRQKKLNDTWYPMLFDYLDEDVSSQELVGQVKHQHFFYFGNFIKEFFQDIKGEDKTKLTQLLIEMGYNEYMMRALNNTDIWKRVQATYFLGLMNCQTSVPLLQKLIFDPSQNVRNMAISNLMKLKDGLSLKTILENLPKISSPNEKNNILIYLLEFGPDILPSLQKIYRESDLEDWGKQICVEVFKHFVDYSMQDDLLETYQQTEDLELKAACIKALASFEDPRLIVFFENELESGQFLIQYYCINALGMLQAESSLDKIVKYAEHPDFWMSKQALEAIAEYRDERTEIYDSLMQSTASELTRELILEIQSRERTF